MKIYLFIILLFLLTSCNQYSKEVRIKVDTVTEKTIYTVYVFDETPLMFPSLIGSYSVLITETDPRKQIDSVNALADSLIAKLEYIESLSE